MRWKSKGMQRGDFIAGLQTTPDKSG